MAVMIESLSIKHVKHYGGKDYCKRREAACLVDRSGSGLRLIYKLFMP